MAAPRILTTAASPEVEAVHTACRWCWRRRRGARLDPGMTDSAAALALLREHCVRAVFAGREMK
jgi:hypothetical protein